jgi:prefoldin alpha subunit
VDEEVVECSYFIFAFFDTFFVVLGTAILSCGRACLESDVGCSHCSHIFFVHSVHHSMTSSPPQKKMDSFQENNDADEVLLASEQLAYAITASQETSLRLERSILSYQSLTATLQHIHQHTRVPILVPVANGLGYFEGELRHTNDVMALLGDNWFAERTVAQAVEICSRRLAFLTKEKEQVTMDLLELEKKQQLLESEFQQQSAASAAAPRVAPSAAARKANPAASQRQTTRVAPGGAQVDAIPAATTMEGLLESSPLTPAGATNKRNSDEQREREGVSAESQDDDLETDDDADSDIPQFHPDDELTDDELEALEKSIDPKRLNDDEYVEKLMLDMMMAKRAARLGFATSAVFGDDDDDDGGAEAGPTVSSSPTSYNTPADIGPRPAAATATGSKEAASQLLSSGDVASRVVGQEADKTKPRKHVSFDLEALDNNAQQEQRRQQQQYSATTTAFLRNTMTSNQPTVAAAAAEVDCTNEFSFEDEFGRRVSVPGLPQQLQQQGATTLVPPTTSVGEQRRPFVSAPTFSPLGSIAERPQRAVGGAGAASPGAGGSVAGRSVFMQRMLGEGR